MQFFKEKHFHLEVQHRNLLLVQQCLLQTKCSAATNYKYVCVVKDFLVVKIKQRDCLQRFTKLFYFNR